MRHPHAIARGERGWPRYVFLGLSLLLGLGLAGMGCGRGPRVVVYCAQDQVHAEPLFAQFTRQTGIRVDAVFDSEAVKTVGLVNRILAEREHPQADLFWGNEEFQTRRLAAAGCLRGTNGWVAFGQRSRRLVASGRRPEWAQVGLAGLTNVALRGRVSIAAPWFGSTATHFTALRAEWGEDAWRAWCRALAANRVFLEEGNSRVVERVARGEAWVGLTDSDDIHAAQAAGQGVVAGPPLWQLRNTVAFLRGSTRPTAADRLAAFLQSAEAVQVLQQAGALEAPTRWEQEPAWDVLMRDYPSMAQELRGIFTP